MHLNMYVCMYSVSKDELQGQWFERVGINVSSSVINNFRSVDICLSVNMLHPSQRNSSVRFIICGCHQVAMECCATFVLQWYFFWCAWCFDVIVLIHAVVNLFRTFFVISHFIILNSGRVLCALH